MMKACYFLAMSGKFHMANDRTNPAIVWEKTDCQHWSLRLIFVGLKKFYENAWLDLWKTGLDNLLKMCGFHIAFSEIASGLPLQPPAILCDKIYIRVGQGKTIHFFSRKPFHTFRDKFWVSTHLVRKPFHTFRDVFLSIHASCPKTVSHFSGCVGCVVYKKIIKPD